MFSTLRRLCDDAYRAQDSGMSVGLPRVNVDASQLKHLLDHWDALVAERDALREENERLRNALHSVGVDLDMLKLHRDRVAGNVKSALVGGGDE